VEIICKGTKKDGAPCRSPVILKNGYCRWHQDQAPEATVSKQPVPWTLGQLESALAAHGGPEGLDLSGIDLSGLDLGNGNLQGVVFGREDENTGAPTAANLERTILRWTDLRRAVLRYANLQGADLRFANLEQADLYGANLIHDFHPQ
jgi:uncharacterized protein YjbI with pentapeptide repeats